MAGRLLFNVLPRILGSEAGDSVRESGSRCSLAPSVDTAATGHFGHDGGVSQPCLPFASPACQRNTEERARLSSAF